MHSCVRKAHMWFVVRATFGKTGDEMVSKVGAGGVPVAAVAAHWYMGCRIGYVVGKVGLEPT